MKTYSRRREPAPIPLVTLALLLLAGTAHGQSFSLASLNCLHLGWGKQTYQQNKATILGNVFGQYDVIILQEVMARADVGSVTPGSHYNIVTATQGPGSYKEAYAFLLRTTIPVAPLNTYFTTNVAGFSRPPAGVLVGAGGQCTWVVDYHAVFGSSIGVRRAEVANMQQVYQSFQGTTVNGSTCNRVVIGGDWNLAANDQVFQNLYAHGWLINVQPNTQTSLKRNGTLSQPYDHFLWDTAVTGVGGAQLVTNAQVIPVPTPPGSGQGWRNQVSDHLGISCNVN
jgi:hypothetical protein